VAMAVGEGFTVISTVIGIPLQAPIDGATVYLTTAGEFVLLLSVWEIVFPVPFEKPAAVPSVNAAVQE